MLALLPSPPPLPLTLHLHLSCSLQRYSPHRDPSHLEPEDGEMLAGMPRKYSLRERRWQALFNSAVYTMKSFICMCVLFVFGVPHTGAFGDPCGNVRWFLPGDRPCTTESSRRWWVLQQHWHQAIPWTHHGLERFLWSFPFPAEGISVQKCTSNSKPT